MMPQRARHRLNLAALAALALGTAGCIAGGVIDAGGFYRAWLCAYLFWLGVPLAAVALVLVHDLSGGAWMASARPVLMAAIATMPLATLAGIPALVGLPSLYSWTHPAPSLANTFYLNPAAFTLRYALDVALWNGLAAFALWAPRGEAAPIPAGLSWLSGLGLVLLAVSVGFASIDWIMSLDPAFWSSIFSYAAGAGWFNTGLALVLLVIAVAEPAAGPRREHMADLAAILFATAIFWAYAEFIQFLIIWEEDLGKEIPWYLIRLTAAWRPALFVSVALGFFVPFFVLLWRPAKRSRAAVAAVCGLILVGRVAGTWWLVLPQYHPAGPFWLDAAALLAAGGPVLLLFRWAMRHPGALRPGTAPLWKAGHG